jgi:hypothetical protein
MPPSVLDALKVVEIETEINTLFPCICIYFCIW